MNKTFYFLTAAFFLCAQAAPLHAQPLKRLGKNAVQKVLREEQSRAAGALKNAAALTPEAVRAAEAANPAVRKADRAMDAALKKAAAAAKQMQTRPFLRHLRQSVFLVRPENPYAVAATGFVFAVSYEGRVEVWGVIAQHMAGLTGQRFPAVFVKDGREVTFEGEVVVQGNEGRLDAALVRFEPTEEFLQTVIALRLSDKRPSVHSKTFSYGHSTAQPDAPFYAVSNTDVLQAGPNRLGRVYAYEPRMHAGACGGPVLNSAREVVGMHCGASTENPDISPAPQFVPQEGQTLWPIASADKRISQAVPADRLLDLVRAYHNRDLSALAVRWNGVQIGSVNVDERITAVQVFAQNRLLRTYRAQDHEPFLDEAHLERFVNAQNADELRVEIETADARPPHPAGRRIYVDAVKREVIKTEEFYW